MSLFHNPSLHTDGLIMYIDPANSASYSGTGLTVANLTSVSFGSLKNGVTFSTSNQGQFVFDGTNDHITYTLSNITTILTIEMWANIRKFHAGMPFGFSLYDVFMYAGGIGFNTGNSDLYGITSAQVSGLGISSNWAHYVFEMRSDVSYTNNKMYINGQLQSLSTILPGEFAANRNFNSGNMSINGWLINTSFKAPMDLGNMRVYNRQLSSQEILDNFYAMKGRYY